MPDPAPVRSLCPVLGVADVERSLAWYRALLGGEVAVRWPAPPDAPLYVSLVGDGWSLHLTNADARLLESPSRVYLLVDDVDAFALRVQAAGHTLEFGPEKSGLGVVECGLKDPDGNQLTFGEPPRRPGSPARG